MIYDLPDYIDLSYFKLEEEGDFETIKEREIQGSEKNANCKSWLFLFYIKFLFQFIKKFMFIKLQ